MSAKKSGGSGRRRGGKGKGKGKGGGAQQPTLTSVPTGRAAYSDTRQWLLKQHGPVCAYCEKTVPVRTITLDHVTPRRGQTAYDRRDNLVLACKSCNTAKADKSILAYLLGNRARAVALWKYGQHLSTLLVQMARDLIPGEPPPIPGPPAKPKARRKTAAEIAGPDHETESPYDEPSPYLDG